MASHSYASAGVDIDAGNKAVSLMGEAVRSTYGPEVLLGIGAFGGLFDATRLKDYEHPVLVGSTDGVGTKTVVASALGSFETIGQDIVNHCINDILVQGAEPLFFLDYVAMSALVPEHVASVVKGVAVACRAAGCAILGGETAEMPDVYQPGEIDLAGTIVGVVERGSIIDGSTVVPGDILLGIPSSGLHTNGFSLVRRIFSRESWSEGFGLNRTLGEALVEPHRSYLEVFRALRAAGTIKAMAHITGGGFYENVPRVLPEGCGAWIERSSWQVPALFQLIQREGAVHDDEMYRVFNMGMGLVVMVSEDEAEAMLAAVPEAQRIGTVTAHAEGPRVVMA